MSVGYIIFETKSNFFFHSVNPTLLVNKFLFFFFFFLQYPATCFGCFTEVAIKLKYYKNNGLKVFDIQRTVHRDIFI